MKKSCSKLLRLKTEEAKKISFHLPRLSLFPRSAFSIFSCLSLSCSRSGLSRRNKHKDDIIDDQSHNPIEVSNVNDNLSSCYLPIDSKLTDSNVNENQVNCPVNLGHCNNNRINSNHQIKNNNNYNKNNKNQSNNAVANESHSGHHCSSSVLIGNHENVHHSDEETELIEVDNREPGLDSQNETHLIDDTNQSFQNVGIHEGNDHQSTDCCPVDSPDNLSTSTLVNQVTFKQYESLLPKKALKNENNGPLNNNQLDHLQSAYSCNHNSSNLISQNDHMNLEASLDNRIHSFDHHETSTGHFNDPLSKLLLERIRLLEGENTNLIAESEQQRIQYEKCLDDVAASVVNALLSQKNLRQECVQLRRRVRELEQQNQLLTLVLEEQLVTSSNKSKSDATLINNFNNNHVINLKNKDPLNNTSSGSKDSSIVNNNQIYLTANGSSLLPLSSLGKFSSDKLNDNDITNGDDDSNRPARNDNLNYTDSQTNAIINSEYISPCSYLSSTSSSNSLPTSSSSVLSEMARQFEQALSSLLADSTSPKEMAYQPTMELSPTSSSSTSSPSSSSNKLPKDYTVLYSNEANFSINAANEVQSITTSSSFVKPANTRETIETRKSSVDQIKMKMDHEDLLKGKEKYVLVNGETGYCWRTSSDRNEVNKEIDDVDGVSGPINCSNGSSTGLRQLARPSRESFLTSLKMEKDSSLYPTSSDFHSLSVNSNGVSILPSSSPSIFSSLGQGQSMSSSPTSTTATVTSSEPEKLSRKIRESFESDCCRSMKRPHYSFNNRNHNVESYKETRSSQYSGNCLSTQSMSEFNSKLGYQSNIIDRSEGKIRREDFISSKPRTTITETSTSTITAKAIKTISPSTSVSLLDNKLKLSSSNSIDLTKLKSSPSNQICSLVNTSQKKSSSSINLVHNLTSIHSSSSSSSSSLPPSSSLIHSSTSSSFSSTLAGSPLSSSSSCSSPKKILFDRNADNAETSNLDSSLFQANARSNQQEKRILFILASNQPNPSSISSSLSSFSSASSSSSSFSIEKSSCDNKSISKPINLELRALSSSSSDSKSIPSLDKDSPISGEISSDTNGELTSKDEGYSTMSSDVQSDATLSGSSFISTNNANTAINSTKTIFPVNPSTPKQSTEINSGKTILIEKQNFTTSKPLPLSALVSKQSGETVEIRSGSIMGVNGSATPIPMKLSAVNPIVVGSCRLTTFKDLPEDCSTKSTISTQNTSFTSSNDNCNNNNSRMDVLQEEEDCIEKDKTKPTEDYNLNINCSKTATNGNKSSLSDNCEAHNLNSSRLTRQPNSDIMRKSKKANHPHRYTFPPTSKAVTVDGVECTPCVVSDFRPSLRADFKSIGFLCNSLTKKSTQSIDSNDWLKSRLIDTTEKITDFCDKDESIYLNHCIVTNNDSVDDVKMNSEKCLNAVDANGDNFVSVIGQTNIKADVVRSRRLTSFKGEVIKQENKGSDLETDEKGYDENRIVTFNVGKPGFKRKSMIVAHCNHVNKLGSSSSSSSSAGSHSLSRSYSDSQLYSDSKDKIASIKKKRSTHKTTSTCKPSSGFIRRRAKRDTRACNQSLRWSTLSTSSSALSDGLEAPICYERKRCRPRPTDLPVKYISSDENHSADDEDSHEKFVSRWLRNGTGGLRWDDSEVTWKLNESLDWPESLDYISSKKDDNFEEIPLLDDESDKIEIVTSVLPSSSKAEVGDNSSDQASSVLDDNLVPETNFNGDFYRLCSVGSKTSLPEVPGLLASTSFPLTDVKEQESIPDADNLSSYSVIKESIDDIDLNKAEIVQRQCLDSNQDDEEILVITTDAVDHSVESTDQQKQSISSPESAPSTSELPVKSLHPTTAIKIESKERDENSIKSETDDKIVIINHIPINPATTKTSSSCASTTTSFTSPTKSLSPCSSSLSVKSSNSGQSITDKCKQTKSTINASVGLKEKKPLKMFKSPIKEPTMTIVNKNLKENHEENVKERSTLRDFNRTERSSENGLENVSLSSSQTRPISSLIKSHSSNYAKLSSATRIPLPKQSNSLDQIKTNKDNKLRHDTTETGERMNTKNLIAKFSASSKKPIKQELPKSSINNSAISNFDSSNSTGLISANSRKNEEKSEKCKEYIKNVEAKRLRSEKSYNRSRKTNDVNPNELKSPTAPSVEEFERRLSEDKQMAEKIKEFYSLFEERQSSNVECSSNKSKVNNSDKQLLESIQCKLNYPKAILRRPKGEPSKTTKEGHETSWVHVSGFSVGKSENYVEKPTSSPSTVINNNKNSASKLSSDSCSSEDEASFNINGKKRSSFHQRLLALHRSRRQRKRASGRYMGMGFLPRIRASIVDRLDFYHRFGEKEQEALSSFNFLNEFSISPLSSSSSSPVIECFEKFAEEQKLLISCYLNSFSLLSQSSSLPASCSPPFTSKWPQSPSSSSLKCSPSRHQTSVTENTNYINDSELNRKTIGTDYVDLITPNSFV